MVYEDMVPQRHLPRHLAGVIGLFFLSVTRLSLSTSKKEDVPQVPRQGSGTLADQAGQFLVIFGCGCCCCCFSRISATIFSTALPQLLCLTYREMCWPVVGCSRLFGSVYPLWTMAASSSSSCFSMRGAPWCLIRSRRWQLNSHGFCPPAVVLDLDDASRFYRSGASGSMEVVGASFTWSR
ncbi:hypothetical protein EYF80_054729 [Liparis tanakae]|uniref:Uncharacterized protein n=1 Tax=Liparis tanakae TaxID=230148 RepID=A0A4Z2F2J4_9TELE|nr:hypothetical protein EYF80_054729 [Liparis tanakae]